MPASKHTGIFNILGALICVSLFGASLASAAGPQSLSATILSTRSSAQETDALKRWQSLSDSEKDRLRQNYQKWKTLPQDRRAALRERFDRFRKLDPDRRSRVLRNFERFKQLPPDTRQKIRDRFQRFQKLPPELRQRRIEELRKMRQRLQNDPQRAQKLQNLKRVMEQRRRRN